MCQMELKNNIMRNFLIIHNMCSCIKQVAKDFFFSNGISQTGGREEGSRGSDIV